MADLISRIALLAEYDRQHEGEAGRARKLIENAPAVDAVEVVRCKDCKHYRTYSTFVVDCCRGHGMTYVNANDFCNYGERKENG